MSEQQTTSLGWGETKGGAQKSGLPLMKMERTNTFRIVSGVIPRYVYWIKNSEGKERPFECLAFNRKTERYENTVKDPIREAGLTQKDEKGQTIPLRSKRAYVAMVINRKTGKIEALDLKKTIFDGIMKVAAKLGKSPFDFDITVEKEGSSWSDTKYSIDQLACAQSASKARTQEEIEADQKLVEELGSTIDELYPRPSYEEVKESLAQWLSGTAGASGSNSNTDEAINELDD